MIRQGLTEVDKTGRNLITIKRKGLNWATIINTILIKMADTTTIKVKTDSKKIILAQKYTTNKKSTILVQSPLNLVKMIIPWVGNIAKISAKSE